jgi:hypothetical protein
MVGHDVPVVTAHAPGACEFLGRSDSLTLSAPSPPSHLSHVHNVHNVHPPEKKSEGWTVFVQPSPSKWPRY